jgi:tRNA nucleotidyltransferase (CCA-adding enzyme)
MDAEVLRLCEVVRDAGGRAMLVGGSVRDSLLGVESKDFDVEVYGLEPARLRSVLERLGQVNTVGEHFAVYKLVFHRPPTQERFEIDVSLPRRESKSGSGHRGFVIEGDPRMTFEQAARRRDFTINAILYDPLTDETIDPYGGKEDFEQRILRAVAADTFVEDSLRVLRAVQLAARFEMRIDPATVELCRKIDLSDLPHERIWGEVEKWLKLSRRPSIGLDAALELGVLDKLFPEIRALVGRAQHDQSQSELDSFAHTGRALDEAVSFAGELPEPKFITVMLATLCHDLGDPAGRVSADRRTAAERAKSVLTKLGVHSIAGYDVRSQAMALVGEQLEPVTLYRERERSKDGDFRRLAQRVEIDLLYRVAKACALAGGTVESKDAVEWFIERARSLAVEHGPPPPLLQGRHLLDIGFEPGPKMGQVLRRVYELQLDGKVTDLDEALAAAKRSEL